MNYRIITAPPRDRNEAMVLICTTIEKNVGRLEKLLKEYEAIEAEEADERYDRAALDCSRAFERHRRYQSARTRELLRVLEEFRRMKKEVASGQWPVASEGKREMADGEGAVASDQWPVVSGGECQVPDDKWQMTGGEAEATDEVVDPVVEQDSSLVIEDSTNDKIGILSYEAMDATDGTGEGQAPKKAQNEANSEMTQAPDLRQVESKTRDRAGRERSQSAAGGQGGSGAGDSRVKTVETIITPKEYGGAARERRGPRSAHVAGQSIMPEG